jgi:hypothetical protein
LGILPINRRPCAPQNTIPFFHLKSFSLIPKKKENTKEKYRYVLPILPIHLRLGVLLINRRPCVPQNITLLSFVLPCTLNLTSLHDESPQSKQGRKDGGDIVSRDRYKKNRSCGDDKEKERKKDQVQRMRENWTSATSFLDESKITRFFSF